MASESEQLAYLREHQPALETVLIKAVGATVSARSDDPVHFLVTYLAEAVGLVVRSRPSKRLREIGFKAMVIGATVREVVGLRQWIPESSAGIQDEVGGLDPILPERYKSIARDKTFSQRVVHPAVRVTGRHSLTRMLTHRRHRLHPSRLHRPPTCLCGEIGIEIFITFESLVGFSLRD